MSQAATSEGNGAVITLRPAALARDRIAPLLPFLFAALLCAGLAMQAKLLPVKPMRLEFPSDAGILAGAAPEESVAPPSASVAAPVAVLPRDSVPDETVPPYSTPSVAMVAPDIEAPSAGAAAGAVISPATGLPGSGNLLIRSNRPHAISTLTLNLMQTIQRIRSNVRSPGKAGRRPAALKAQQPAAKRAAALAPAAKAGLPASGLGGAAGSWGGLGGPAMAASLAASINGTTMRRKF